MHNEIHVKMSSLSQNEAQARVVVAAFVSGLDPTIGELTDIKTAVAEAVTNAIIHGYEKDKGFVTLSCRIDDKDIYIEVKDDGAGIDNIEQAMTPCFTSKPEMERSGLGFTFMESFMDSVEVISEKSKGTRIIMKKRLA